VPPAVLPVAAASLGPTGGSTRGGSRQETFSAGADASQIPGGQRGVGLLLAEDHRPVRLKAFYLADHDVQTIAERAASRRADAWHAAGGAAVSEGAPV
jgi:hypothetical protein